MLGFLSVLLAATCVASPSHPANSFSPYGGTNKQKFLWIVSPRLPSELYIDVDGGRFSGGTRRIDGVTRARWRDQPSTVIVTHPGCLRFHIGGPNGFARTITVAA